MTLPQAPLSATAIKRMEKRFEMEIGELKVKLAGAGKLALALTRSYNYL